MRVFAITTVLMAAMFVQGGWAAECVTKPPPTCVEGGGVFENKEAENACRADIKIYQKSVTEFWDCQRENSSLVDKDARRVIRFFNCRRRGKETCE